MKVLENMLREKMGLDAASIGSSLLQRIVRLRMKTLALKRVEDYRQLLRTSPEEWSELVESVIVTESWFFRDREPFAALVRLVYEEWLPAHPTAPLRILSLPCSAGEEPYSIAMALLDAGVAAERFQIDAADISARALARAQAGTYRKHSFRGQDLGFRDRFFVKTKDGFLLKAAIRQSVKFFQGNVLVDDFFANKGAYDFIFCRNLLIYFDAPTRQKALAKIEQLLARAGVLFVGPAEQPLVLAQGFVSAGIPMAFACRKFGQPTPANAAKRGQQSKYRFESATGLRRPRLAPDSGRRILIEDRRSDARQEQRAGNDAAANLEAARRHADVGQLEKAAEICETHLRENGASADAYYLLGLVLDARGDENAVEYYRKALYLEPNHYEALLQMAVHSRKNGDLSRADAFKNRALRINLKTQRG